MCGIAGIVRPYDSAINPSLIEGMLDSLKPRGPDSGGWVGLDKEGNAHLSVLGSSIHDLRSDISVLGARRLSVMDISAKGNQPMHDPSKRYYVVFNGEIFNFREMRNELKLLGHGFSSNSDTEIIPAAFAQWGRNCFPKFNGQFSIAIYDKVLGLLTLCRDRLGVKPLYYHVSSQGVVFASEIKAVLKGMKSKAAPNTARIAQKIVLPYKLHSMGEDTFFSGIYQIPPGWLFQFSNNEIVRKECYWSTETVPTDLDISFSLGKEILRDTLIDAVEKRTTADRSVAFILSGGIDSSAVTGIARQVLDLDVETFSLSLPDKRFNEDIQIQEIVDHLGVRNNSIEVNADDACNIVPTLIDIYDEPVPTPNGILHALLADAIKKMGHVVALNGVGGDEGFCGYHDHFLYNLGELKDTNSNRFDREYQAWLFGQGRGSECFEDFENFRRGDVFGYNPDFLSRSGGTNYNICLSRKFRQKHAQDVFFRRSNPLTIKDKQIIDLTCLTLPHALVMDDRTYSSRGLEARHPFLDYRLVELGLSLPNRLRINHGFSKFLLRSAVRGFIPHTRRSDMKKVGLNLPIDEWMRGPLHGWVNDNLLSTDSPVYEFADRKTVQKLVIDHLNSIANHSLKIWDLINLNMWLKKFN
ncbi:MAG: asparagine synthase (glutamine-hydrolyzing) [Legionellales bacterium]|nr:asparagine synthase (glutamine-hydrolyzing) [Legionellales bacterium]